MTVAAGRAATACGVSADAGAGLGLGADAGARAGTGAGTGFAFAGPDFSSDFTTALNVLAVAHICGDVSWRVDACESAPYSISVRTTSVCPKNAASASAVNLSLRFMFAS